MPVSWAEYFHSVGAITAQVILAVKNRCPGGSSERSRAAAPSSIWARNILDLLYYLLGDIAAINGTLDTLIKERPSAAGTAEKVPVDVDDIALLTARLADGALGTVEISRMGTGATNDLTFEIFGDKGAIRWALDDPAWLYVYDARDADSPFGGERGFRKIEAVGRYAGQKAPDLTMTPDFMRVHAECQYQFIRSIQDDKPTSPSLDDGLYIQRGHGRGRTLV